MNFSSIETSFSSKEILQTPLKTPKNCSNNPVGHSEFSQITQFLTVAIPKLQTEQLLDPFLSHLTTANWQALISSAKNGKENLLSLDALNLLREGKIAVSQCVTSIFLHALMESYPQQHITARPIFDLDDRLDPFAERALKETIGAYLTPAQTTLFFEKMRLQPQSERSFFSIELPPKKAANNRSITEYISSLNSNVFYSFEEKLLVPSFSMMQELLRAKKGNPNLHLEPFLHHDLPPIDNLTEKNTLKIIIPFEKFPSTITGYTSNTRWDCIYYGFFCALTAASIPEAYFSIFEDFSKIILDIKEKSKDNSDIFSYLETYYKHIISMNHVTFLDAKQEVTASFFKSIELTSSHILNVVYPVSKPGICPIIIDYLVKELVSKNFLEAHNISIPALKRLTADYLIDIENGTKIKLVLSAFNKWGQSSESWKGFFKEAFSFLQKHSISTNHMLPHQILEFASTLPSFEELLEFIDSLPDSLQKEGALNLSYAYEATLKSIKELVLTVQIEASFANAKTA